MRRMFLIAAVLLLPATPFAQEVINLTTPIARPSITGYQPASLYVQVQPVPRITVTIIHLASGDLQTFSYPCAPPCSFATDVQVATLIGNLNTVNLTTRSLWNRIFDRLVLDFPARFVGGATVP